MNHPHDIEQTSKTVKSSCRLYCVYKLTCIPTDEIYVGITCQKVEKRWRKGKSYKNNKKLYAAIQKYGWDNFSKEILETGLKESEAPSRERFYIEKFNSLHKGFNNSIGGEISTEEKMARTSRSLSGRKIPKYVRTKMSIAAKGRIFSDEHKRHLSESHIGKPSYWEGKQRSEETNAKISEKLSIPIRCIETGIIYRNCSDLASEFGVAISTANKWANGANSKTNLHFEKVV